MTPKDKQKIVDLLQVYIKQKGSQNKAAASLKGVSPAVVSHLLNGNWEPYSVDMFRNIGNQIGYSSNHWQFVETTNAKQLLEDLQKAKQQQSVLTFLGNAGSGKSEITKKYASETPDAIRVECAGYWDEKHFLQEILMQMGVRNPHNRVPQMMHEIITRLKGYDTPPILIIDEVDKLGDRLLYFLITFYNELRWKCSIALLSTYYFKKRLEDGLRNRKKGYEELLSRYGVFVDFEQTSAADVALLCEGQGVTDRAAIKTIQKKSREDLRSASELIRIFKLENAI
ncbi:ATP-binding protein [Pseudotamlana carrageenivorans]|uniref:ATPase n=1 Tax=Pseudotamlana carrageenivorans TaxID=2069432 RepID=A0A2I7SKN8_9FLAO|nr:ATP-binding protein [Tamlana carrageenivorans]AUS06452.1 ATPase [Tamlana carrageenivorans]